MIYQRAAVREFASTAVPVFVALFAILLTTQLVRLLGQAAGGNIVSEAVVALLSYAAVTYLPVLLSLTLFISILLSLSRSYRDSEMMVWFSCGLPLTAWVRPVLVFSLPLVLIIGALSLYLSPWALAKSLEYRHKMENRDDVARVTPGVFRESSSADRVFFVEEIAGQEGRVKNVFISSREHGRLGIMAAAQGRQEITASNDRFLVLENGRRYEGTPGQADYRTMQFERYAVRIESRAARGAEEQPKALSTWELLQHPTGPKLGEMLWRIGLPVTALNLALLAIPLSFVNPRAGRTANLIFALLAYMTYSNLLSVSQAWVAQERLRFEVGLWAVHAAMLVLLLLLFYRRLLVFSWQRLWRRKSR